MTLITLAIAWSAGIVLAHLLWAIGIVGCDTPPWPLAATAVVALTAGIGLRRRPQPRLVAFLLLMMALGGWRYLSHPLYPCSGPEDLRSFHADDRKVWVTLEGTVTGYPDVRDTTTGYRVSVDSLEVGATRQGVRGLLQVTLPRHPAFTYGDRLRLTGLLLTPPVYDDFDYRAYLARRGVHSVLYRPSAALVGTGGGDRWLARLYAVRARGSAFLNRALPEPAAAVANGILLGIESGIPDELDADFRATGTAHVVVISGSNIALLTGVLMTWLGRLVGRRRAVWPAMGAVIVYVLLVGADPAALRAGLMGILYIIAVRLGRESSAHVSLFAAAILMTAQNPLVLWDAGFQLSFAATLGLILFTPGIAERLEAILARLWGANRADGVMRLGGSGFAATLAGQAAILPLIAHYFGTLSPSSLLTNALILPAQPPIMAAGLLATLTGLIWEPAGRVLAAVPWLFITYTIKVVQAAARLPLASVAIGILPVGGIVAYYLSLVALPRLVRGRSLFARRGRWAVAALVPLWLIASLFAALPDGRLHVTFTPDESEPSATIRTPAGRVIWVCGGGAAQARRPSGSCDVAIVRESAGKPACETEITAGQAAPGATVRLESGLTLVRVDDGDGWSFRMEYGGFGAVVPAGGGPVQVEIGGKLTAVNFEEGQPGAVELISDGSRAWVVRRRGNAP